MDIQVKQELKALQDKIDFRTGRMKRILTHGWLSQPAWIRAIFWATVGGFTVGMLK